MTPAHAPRPSARLTLALIVCLLVAATALLPGCKRRTPGLTPEEQTAAALDRALEAARDAIHAGDTDAALEATEAARQIDPDSHRPLTVRARVLMDAGRLAESRAAYQSAARLAEAEADRRIESIVDIATQAAASAHPDAQADADFAIDRTTRAAGDAMLAAGSARLMAAFAEARQRGPVAELDAEALDEADATFARAADVADRLGLEDDGGRGTTARLHRALINALRGNRDAAITQIEMLEVGRDYDAELAAFWKQVIRDGTLRARLVSDRP
ncbi:MAG: hypothetical protein AAF078_03100 [Planctomycetota bacterium]